MVANWSNLQKKIETKIRSHDDEATDFHSKKISEEGSDYICLLVVLIDSVLEKYESCYLQVFLQERKCT